MAREPFATSRTLKMGIELELVNRHDYDLVGPAEDLPRRADRLNIGMCGGGTHGVQYLSDLYGYLSRQLTILTGRRRARCLKWCSASVIA
jgi:hypothetical protein